MDKFKNYIPLTFFISCKELFAADIERFGEKKIKLFIEKGNNNTFRLWRKMSKDDLDREVISEKSDDKIKMSAWLGSRLRKYLKLKKENIVHLNRRMNSGVKKGEKRGKYKKKKLDKKQKIN